MGKGRNKGGEQPGNAIAAQAAFDRQVVEYGALALRFERALENNDENGVWIRQIKFVLPDGDKPETMGIVTGRSDEGAVVSFVVGATFAECLLQTLRRIENRSLKWRDDKYQK